MSIADELALRCGLDPAWDCVLREWLIGHDLYPDPFRPRHPA